jgi:hypothetical protein
MANTEIRRRILELLYERFTDHPYNRVTHKEFKEMFDIGLKELHFNIIYLEEKGYVELSKPLEGSIFVGARITPRGVDLVEDEYELNVLFPFKTTDSHLSDAVFEQLDNLIVQTSELADLSSDSKELIIEELRSIKNELRKDEPVYSEIKKNVDRIRNRHHLIWQKMIEIIREPAVAKVLSKAAKNELGI